MFAVADGAEEMIAASKWPQNRGRHMLTVLHP